MKGINRSNVYGHWNCTYCFKTIVKGKYFISRGNNRFCISCAEKMPWYEEEFAALLKERMLRDGVIKVELIKESELDLQPKLLSELESKIMVEDKPKLKRRSFFKRIQVKRNKEYVKTWKEQGCYLCAESDLVCIEAHHLDPSSKNGDVFKLVETADFEDIETELKKCIPLCRNCHRKLHHGRFSVLSPCYFLERLFSGVA